MKNAKKYVVVGLLAFIIPLVTTALEKPTGISQDDGNVWDALIVLISQLTRQIDALTTENTQLRAVCAGATSVPQTQTFGSQTHQGSGIITPTMEPKLDVVVTKQDPNNVLPLGRFYFTAKFVNSEGKSPQGTVISTQFPADHDANSPYGTEETFTKNSNAQHFEAGEYSVQFGPYNPTTKGTKIVTFSSNGISKNVEIVVE